MARLNLSGGGHESPTPMVEAGAGADPSIPAAVMPGGSDKQDATSHKRTNHKAPQNALSSQGKVAATSDLQGSVVDLKASENDSDDDDDDDDDDVKNSYLGAHFGAMNGKHTANRLCAPRVKDTVATRAPEAEDGSDHQSAAEHPTQEAPQRLGRPRKRKDAPPASDGNKDSRPAKKTKVPRRGPEAGATPSRHSTRAAALLAASSIAQQNNKRARAAAPARAATPVSGRGGQRAAKSTPKNPGPAPAPARLGGRKTWSVEGIADARLNMQTGEVEYLIKWAGFPQSSNTWEPKQNLNCPRLVTAFHAAQAKKGRH